MNVFTEWYLPLLGMDSFPLVQFSATVLIQLTGATVTLPTVLLQLQLQRHVSSLSTN